MYGDLINIKVDSIAKIETEKEVEIRNEVLIPEKIIPKFWRKDKVIPAHYKGREHQSVEAVNEDHNYHKKNPHYRYEETEDGFKVFRLSMVTVDYIYNGKQDRFCKFFETFEKAEAYHKKLAEEYGVDFVVKE